MRPRNQKNPLRLFAVLGLVSLLAACGEYGGRSDAASGGAGGEQRD